MKRSLVIVTILIASLAPKSALATTASQNRRAKKSNPAAAQKQDDLLPTFA